MRRVLGVTVASAPVALLVASLLADDRASTAGLVVMLVGLAIASTNLALALRRGERRISGIPLIGTLLVVAGGIVGFGSTPCAVLGLIALAIDTGGVIWFVIGTWRDPTLWG